LALATPVSGVAWSSKGASSTVKPISCSLALFCSSANCAPFLMAVPSTDCGPLNGDCEATLITRRWLLALLLQPRGSVAGGSASAGASVAAGASAAGASVAAGAGAEGSGAGAHAETTIARISNRARDTVLIRILSFSPFASDDEL
jgi:hypothetical protein